MMKNSKLPHLIIENEQDRYMAFRAAEAAIAASGTVALELAIVNVPHIIAYKVSPFTGWLAKHLLHIQFVNLSNIILGREVVPELLQERCDASNIEHYILSLLSKGDLYEKRGGTDVGGKRPLVCFAAGFVRARHRAIFFSAD